MNEWYSILFNGIVDGFAQFLEMCCKCFQNNGWKILKLKKNSLLSIILNTLPPLMDAAYCNKRIEKTQKFEFFYPIT
jgi:hypothetical protein